jgi:hypothetical protein
LRCRRTPPFRFTDSAKRMAAADHEIVRSGLDHDGRRACGGGSRREVPDWLERVEAGGSPLAVYRVKHQKYDAD